MELKNSLYGLQNMDCRNAAVQAVLKQIAPKVAMAEIPDTSYVVQLLIQACYQHPYFFQLYKESQCAFVNNHKTIEALLDSFIVTCIKTKYNSTVLDLHELSHFVAEHLLSKIDLTQVTKIIFGTSTHSKDENRGKMKALVSDRLAKVNCMSAFQ